MIVELKLLEDKIRLMPDRVSCLSLRIAVGGFNWGEKMVVEWLKIKVEAEHRLLFIEVDAAIWTPALAACDGFLHKEVWLDAQYPDQVIFIIHWQTKEQWHAIPADYLTAVELEFQQKFPYPSKILESLDYQLFPSKNINSEN